MDSVTDSFRLTVNYEPAHLYAIYYPQGPPTIFNYRPHRKLFILLFVCVIFLLVGCFNLIMSQGAPDEFSVLLLVASLLFGTAGVVMLIKSIRNFRESRDNRERYVGFLCSRGPVEIIVDKEGIAQQTSEGITTVRWTELTDAEVTQAFVYVTDGKNDWLYPRASMSASEFEVLVEVVQRNYSAG